MSFKNLLEPLNTAVAQKKILQSESNALRLLNAEASGSPGLVLEVYGSHAVAYDYSGEWSETLRQAGEECLKLFGWQSLLVKDRGSAGDNRNQGFVAAGKAPARYAVQEGPLQFWVEPQHPRNVGLFLDTRILRQELATTSQNKHVLNLFSYTCSLGIAALYGGAALVINVDISARYLDWGRENLLLNKLTEEKSAFKKMDSERFLDWATKNQRMFDTIILDPPVFARFDGGVFRFEADYFRLVQKCVACLKSDGSLFALTNFSAMPSHIFNKQVIDSIHQIGRNVSISRKIPLPPEFDVQDENDSRPEGNALIYEFKVT